MDSVKILLFSDDEKLYNSTERIIGKKHQLKWCTYQQLENNRYPTADVVIFHFTKEIIGQQYMNSNWNYANVISKKENFQCCSCGI